MSQYEITHRDGKPYVMIPLHEYRTAIQKDIESKAEEYFKNKSYDVPEGINPIRYFRKEQGLTQVQLASKAGISRTYLTEIETGAKNGSVAAINKLSNALAVPLDALVKPKAKSA
ncbi:MAG: transcriptional regulator [Micavibrio sp.]|nr:transcriptional regulator [Micavibrio sp.]|tara:strand:- start:222431 stop:222775 length:345 start_codon:yes stop_codon:yes gene_type:complete